MEENIKWHKQLLGKIMVEEQRKEESWFLRWLAKLGRKRVIPDPITLEPYLIRYYLLFKDVADSRAHKFNIFLHNIKLSDLYHLHDHPWWYITIILKGGYWENTPKGRFWRRPGYIGLYRPESLHRLETEEGKEAWTLFIRFNFLRDWGFLVDGKWIYWKEYHARRLFEV